MKLTDEQREDWIKHIEWAKKNGIQHSSVSVSALESIVQSEQAWKEEAERLQVALHVHESYDKTASELYSQLNQAIEVLKWIDSSDFYNPISVTEIKARAAYFLSSLKEDKP